jgi:hypothetical protein
MGVGLVSQLVLFLMLPIDSSYLTVSVPMVLILLGLVLRTPAVLGVALAIAVSPFWSVDETLSASILEDHDLRVYGVWRVGHLARRIHSRPPGSVVSVRWRLPQVLVMIHARSVKPGVVSGGLTPVTLRSGQVIARNAKAKVK